MQDMSLVVAAEFHGAPGGPPKLQVYTSGHVKDPSSCGPAPGAGYCPFGLLDIGGIAVLRLGNTDDGGVAATLTTGQVYTYLYNASTIGNLPQVAFVMI